jgi:hypothetical protein
VTVALQGLEEQGLIKTSRGCVRVLDRGGLEAKARGLYGVPEAEYARLMGEPPGRSQGASPSRADGPSGSEGADPW